MADPELEHAYDTVNLLRHEGVAVVELNRPRTRNAWTPELAADLLAAFAHVTRDPELRAVLLRGAGPGFSSGADLRAGFDTTPEGHPDVRGPLRHSYHPVLLGIRRMPKPVVASVRGAAAGIGCSLALCCDLIVAAESAFFQLAFVNIGLVPDGGSTALLPARVGLARAAELALLGERLPAPEAHAWGLVNRVVADDELDEASLELAGRLARGPTHAYAGMKRAFNSWALGRMEQQLELEADLQQHAVRTADFLEGASAFLAKREPRFTGR